MRQITLIAAAALAMLAGAAQANLVNNGGFETFASTACSGNSQQLNNTNASPWNTNSGYTFILNSTNATGGFNTSGCSGLSLYSGSSPSLGPSPNGGNFLAADSNFNTGYTYQSITGLISGQVYYLGFNMAAAQQSGFTGATTDKWEVGLIPTLDTADGAPSGTVNAGFQTSTTLSITTGGFSGWVAQAMSFTASAATETLWFYAVGTPSSGQPPFALLDGVSLQVPEPPAYGILAIGLLALLATRFRRARG